MIDERPEDDDGDRQEIIGNSIGQRSLGVDEASGDAAVDDAETVPEPSIRTILASIRARSEAEGTSSQDAARDGPFARSSGSQAAETLRKPSLKRSQPSVSPASFLHNEAPTVGSKHWKRSTNERQGSRRGRAASTT